MPDSLRNAVKGRFTHSKGFVTGSFAYFPTNGFTVKKCLEADTIALLEMKAFSNCEIDLERGVRNAFDVSNDSLWRTFRTVSVTIGRIPRRRSMFVEFLAVTNNRNLDFVNDSHTEETKKKVIG